MLDNKPTRRPLRTRASPLMCEPATQAPMESARHIKPLQITIQSITGQEFCFEDIAAETTVLSLKVMLADQLNVLPDTVNFLFGTTKLDTDSLTLAQVGLQSEAVLTLIRTVGTSLNQSLLMAIEEGRDQEAIELIDRGAGFDSEGKPVKEIESTILHLAIRSSMEPLALHLIASEADINAVNEMQRQPLSVAAIKGQSSVAMALITARADINHRDRNQNTAMAYEFRNRRLDTAVRLMLNGGNVYFSGQPIV